MRIAGGIFGLPFALEGFAFFLEAIFVGLYFYGWQRLTPLAHWLTTIPLVISGTASAWFVVTANSWMNTPAGFTLANGKVVTVDPIAAMLNVGTPTETMHTILSCYQVTAFGAAAVYAWKLLRGRNVEAARRGLLLGMLIGLIVSPLQALVGDASAKMVAQYQPIKLAAMEALFKTTRDAPLAILGFPDLQSRSVHFAITLPGLLSWLAFGNTNAKVQGLESVAPNLWPDVGIVHLMFDTWWVAAASS